MNEDTKKAMSLIDKLRVVINLEGEATTFTRAKEEYGIEPEIIFIRNDRWALGALKNHSNIAYNMWPESWTHFYLVKEQELKPISEYKK